MAYRFRRLLAPAGAGGTTYSASLAESATAADTLSAAWIGTRSVSETATAVDAQSFDWISSTMATYLKADAVKAVLEDLGVLDRAGNVSALDTNRVGLRYDAWLATFTAKDIVTIPSDAIPDNLFFPLVSFLVEQCAPLFHQERNLDVAKQSLDTLRSIARSTATVTNNATNRLAVRVLRALGVIGRIENPSAKELATITARIDLVLSDLGGRKLITISDADEAEDLGATDALVDYLVALLAPEQENPLPAGQRLPTRQEAERRLRLIGAPEPSYVAQPADYF